MISNQNLELFHVHVPKTAGTSFNHVLSEHFGPRFSDHKNEQLLTNETLTAASAHIPFSRARVMFPKARFVTVLRAPESRVKSTLRHLFARRNWPAYKDIGPLIHQLVDTDGVFVANEDVLNSAEFRRRLENTMVRYLSKSPITGPVDAEQTNDAINNFTNFQFILLQDFFDNDVQAFCAAYGIKFSRAPHRNEARSDIPLWDRFPSALDPLVRHDRVLYEHAVSLRDRV